MMGITDWFKRLGARDDAQAVESAEEKARHEGVPAGDLPADQGSVEQDLDKTIDQVQRLSGMP
jgi:hypothetical protein